MTFGTTSGETYASMDSKEFVKGVNVDTLPVEHLPFLNYHAGLYILQILMLMALPRFLKKLITYNHDVCTTCFCLRDLDLRILPSSTPTLLEA